jgi:two-component system nitrogen regulation response regulator GlnG/two-component system response regulator HydG
MAEITRDGASTQEEEVRRADRSTKETPPPFALVLVWSAHDRARVGEAIVVSQTSVFGRGAETTSDRETRSVVCRRRPFRAAITGPINDPFLSRAQLKLTPRSDGVHVESLGKRPMLLRGSETREGQAHEGDLIEVQGRCIFLCVRCTEMRQPTYPDFPFGTADAHGLVGESLPIWKLRERIAFVAARDEHVLITGPTGSGKENVARAIHAMSPRAKKPIVARNASTLPPGVIDAELFGNAANYPNAGMPERIGLVGQADGSTLFLDEIGEMSPELQAHLLRLLDNPSEKGGEYHRLGESKPRRADIRVICATNRGPDEIKHDLLARLGMRVEVSGLDARREDAPLIARHLLKRMRGKDPSIDAFFESDEPRISTGLAHALLRPAWTGHVRELETLLWDAIAESSGSELQAPAATKQVEPPRTWSAEEIRAALDKHGGVRDRAWRELGMKNRFVLLRLIQKYELE